VSNHSPITPPPELVASLRNSAPHGIRDAGVTREIWLISKAYQAGADQELEACCKWLPKLPPWSADDLRRHRRPKPPSLKEQALLQLDTLNADLAMHGRGCDLSQIRRALEATND
jgi:hypothetical protein